MFDLMEIILLDFFLWCFWFNDSSYEFEKLTRVDIFLTFFFGLIVQHGFFLRKNILTLWFYLIYFLSCYPNFIT